ncbi:hypothetical protein Dbac_0603 [Desulfomicrobium baculatum DSM 4028]|uniref:Uncharacterized protein n=1 Tax=Desulfomicrobium baculatum (strain DSM 4028 / VKM B-1378 / X) TaxID=525897 RepID=C7LX54_DESBD|nr:hypothetical protein Dbac_0603 [Desulfomicrobium baculatum DSM 4028]
MGLVFQAGSRIARGGEVVTSRGRVVRAVGKPLECLGGDPVDPHS